MRHNPFRKCQHEFSFSRLARQCSHWCFWPMLSSLRALAVGHYYSPSCRLNVRGNRIFAFLGPDDRYPNESLCLGNGPSARWFPTLARPRCCGTKFLAHRCDARRFLAPRVVDNRHREFSSCSLPYSQLANAKNMSALLGGQPRSKSECNQNETTESTILFVSSSWTNYRARTNLSKLTLWQKL